MQFGNFADSFSGVPWSSMKKQVLHVRPTSIGGRWTTKGSRFSSSLLRFMPVACCVLLSAFLVPVHGRCADQCRSTMSLMVNRLLEPVYVTLIPKSIFSLFLSLCLGTVIRKRDCRWYRIDWRNWELNSICCKKGLILIMKNRIVHDVNNCQIHVLLDPFDFRRNLDD